ncbi:hypothetical protein NKH18_18950 [Streptomyces sp. M10(2022)]
MNADYLTQALISGLPAQVGSPSVSYAAGSSIRSRPACPPPRPLRASRPAASWSSAPIVAARARRVTPRRSLPPLPRTRRGHRTGSAGHPGRPARRARCPQLRRRTARPTPHALVAAVRSRARRCRPDGCGLPGGYRD